ncbi:DUF3299 domain-containing protein [Polaromonas jejuensis]|uniref:DUF3299 domain-containing protein n=1 Tax=Polaromonas jejuensis TaxID=457502 RepID=A0ABW0QD52_9BURK|nr:DUF3299 domain-containing protein [Polaromonas jejuensis]
MRRLRFVQLDLLSILALICLSTLMLLLPAAAQTVAQSSAAALHDPSTSMLPDARGAVPWSLLSTVTIKMTKGKLGPDFPAGLRPFNGKTVKLQGYILPIEAGQTHSYFLLSAWSPTCPFCQTAGPEAMVEVRARTAVKYSIDPVVVEGRLMLLDNDPSGIFYRLVEAAPASLK